MLCVLCPLLVTAMYFFVDETAMFSGKSPNGKLLPAGVKLQLLGSFIACGNLFSWAEQVTKGNINKQKIAFLIMNFIK